MVPWGLIKNFKPYEFDSPDEKGSGEVNMNKSFIEKLQEARVLADIPFKITSGYRTPSHNKKVGGVGNSSHIYGYAADVKAQTNYERIKIITGAVKAGIKRIGIAKKFIHLDDDPNKNPSLWLYNNDNNIFIKLFNRTFNNNSEDY